MSIKHYGLDAAEIEHLKSANLTDEEINDLNKKRVEEQMNEDKDTGIDDKYPSIPPGALSLLYALPNSDEALSIVDKYFKDNSEFAKAHPELMDPNIITLHEEAVKLRKGIDPSDTNTKNEYLQDVQNGGILGSKIVEIVSQSLDPMIADTIKKSLVSMSDMM